MAKCHLCGMEASLNILLAGHARKHCNDQYPKKVYKRDLLIADGRIPKICPICNQETEIPKGEKDFPIYHKKCYLQARLQGETNPNFKGGKIEVKCANCDKILHKHPSHLSRKLKFCSTSCSTTYYCKPEHMTVAVKAFRDRHALNLKEINSRHEVKEKRAAGMAEAFKGGCSKLEINIFNKLKELYPTATNSVSIGWYVVDILVDKIVVEIQGDYWHTLSGAEAKDRRKKTYLTNKGYQVVYIWEHEWYEAVDKESLIKSKFPSNLPPDII